VLDVGDFLAAVDRVAKGGSALDPYVVGELVNRTEGVFCCRSRAGWTWHHHEDGPWLHRFAAWLVPSMWP
jgi:hypothetical protein